MGIFSWLFGRAKLQFEDRIWCDQEMRNKDLLARTVEAREAGSVVVTFYHQPKTFTTLNALFDENGIPHRVLGRDELLGDGLHNDEGHGTLLADAADLPTGHADDGPGIAKRQELPCVEIHLAEHALLPGPDAAILGLNRFWRNPMRFRAFVSADGELMRLFNAGAKLAAYPGIGRDECLSHRFLSRSLQRAQQRVRKRWGAQEPGQSYMDWLAAQRRQQP